jgi:hypothetical protein
VLPKFDPATATHIVTETNEKNTLSALGLKSLSEIPLGIPTVYWSWVISGKAIPGERDKQQMDYEFMHAAFPSRMDAGRPITDKGKGKQKLASNEGQAPQPGEASCVVSRIHFYPIVCSFVSSLGCVSLRGASPNPSSRGSSCGIDEEVPGVLSDPELRKGRDRLVRTFPAIHEAPLLVTMNRLLAPAAADPARRQVHRPRAHRRKSKGSVPTRMILLIMSSHDYEGIHL